jgi:hypothetical protein
LAPVISRHSRQAVFALAAICALALGLSACGGGETTVTVTESTQGPHQGQGGQGQGGSKKQEEVQSENGVVAGYTDHVKAEGQTLALRGWAAAADLSQPASQVAASVNGKTLAKAVPTLDRHDVVEALGEPGLENSGFELQLPIGSLECGAPYAGIEVTATLNGESGALLFGEGIKEAIADAC